MNSEKTASVWPLKTQLSRELSKTGHHAYSLPNSDVPAAPAPSMARTALDLPELSELSVVRHFTRLSTLNYSIDGGMYPLGSCTMKYNPRINEATASLTEFVHLHPLTPPHLAQGALELMYRLENALAEISGFARVSLQPAAGAQGEYAGIRMIRACLESRGDVRKKILIPESAHGTNPATAALCGYEVVQIKSTERGLLDVGQIEQFTREGQVAGLMVTNPNTCGLFEEQITSAVQLIHERGGLVYCDGANMNAMLGITRPGDAGFDVMHFNLHKTFTTPHGGGGPGCGGVGVSKTLIPFLPRPTVERDPNDPSAFVLDDEREQSIGKVKDFFGHFLMMVRAYTYIRELGAEGIRKAGEDAVLLANYVRMRLRGHYELPFDRPCMHEVVFSDKKQTSNGVRTLDIAKRLIDLGIHPPTVYFPLLIPGALMIEPTETETLESVEGFCATMIQIANEAAESGAFEKYFANAPRNTPYGRINETLAAKDLKLTWKDLL
ncbi:MAG: aminomethyl-transferring glycine dehydrogenase subunit GcvPB [Bdellovibrionales bacterium]|nr:aminomethyl-transferring glycine dehydrogenase subunit GcvPB [Bdellovibrionales bacterium]